jgi:phosphotransferase system  glucose/maltose/N-acetylglucosamine-specific IIC component
VVGAFLAGLCIIVLVALAGIGLAVWFTRKEKKPQQEAGIPPKKDETP